MSEIDSSNGEVQSLYICQNKKCKVKTIKIKLN